MKEVLTDEDIAKIEQLYGVELTNFQKSMFKSFWVSLMNKNKNEDGIWRAHYLGRPIQQVDCNNCKWLNMTEDEEVVKGFGLHKCEFYYRRVRHDNRVVDSRRLYPCDECYKDYCQNFSRRQDHRGLRADIAIIDEFAGEEFYKED